MKNKISEVKIVIDRINNIWDIMGETVNADAEIEATQNETEKETIKLNRALLTCRKISKCLIN